MNRLDGFASGLDGVDYVFFDLFDTFILRDVHPEHVKRLAAKRLCVFMDLALLPDEVYETRRRLETRLCRQSQVRGHDLEFHFEEFAGEFYDELRSMEPEGFYSMAKDEFVALCCELELDVEKSVQRLDAVGVEQLKGFRDKGIPVACISDFYMPVWMMDELFSHHGISGLFDRVFVSCELKVSKRSGRLYDHALSQVGVAPERVLMIGDNEHADFRAACDKGIRCYLVDRAKERKGYERFARDYLSRDKVAGLLESDMKGLPADGDAALMCENVYALFYFTARLHARLVSSGVRDAFFLSKEGQFLKRLFELYQDTQGFGPRMKVRTHYLLASRKSTFIASLAPLEQERFENLFRQYFDISPREFLMSLGFSEDEVEDITGALGIDKDKSEAHFPTSGPFRRIIGHGGFINAYEKRRKTQRQNFIRYLDSFGVDYRADGLYLVDVGWKGTIQDNIHDILGREVPISGHYLGLESYGSAWLDNQKEGVLFSIVPHRSPYCRVYNENRHMFEVVLGATHGSAMSYEEKDGGIEVALEQNSQERELFDTAIRHTQSCIEKRFGLICERFRNTHFHHDEFAKFFAKKHARMVYLPSGEEIRFFQGLYHYENFGLFEFSTFDKQASLGIKRRLVNLARVMFRPYKTLMGRGYGGALMLTNMGLWPLRYAYAGLRYMQLYLEG